MELKEISKTVEAQVQGTNVRFTQNMQDGSINATAHIVVNLTIDKTGKVTNHTPGTMPALAEEIAAAAIAINTIKAE